MRKYKMRKLIFSLSIIFFALSSLSVIKYFSTHKANSDMNCTDEGKYGRLFIPALEYTAKLNDIFLDDTKNYSDAKISSYKQKVIDIYDSAYCEYEKPYIFIYDHNYQGLSKLSELAEGYDEAYILRNGKKNKMELQYLYSENIDDSGKKTTSYLFNRFECNDNNIDVVILTQSDKAKKGRWISFWKFVDQFFRVEPSPE